ncbi:MAG: hypothetical protein ACXVQ6_06400 [Actinomycetota bacterium]
MKRIAIFAACVVLIGLVACGGPKPKTSFSVSPGRPASTGTVTIVSPTSNEVIHGTVMHVKLTLTGARLVQTVSTHITPDTGHIHVSIDGKIKSLLAGLTYDATGLTPGRHLLTVEFVAADHGVFNPRVTVSQTFVVVK